MTIIDAAVLIMGGAGGIGSATARLAARRGAQVIVADIDSLRAADVADEIGGRAMSVVLDVTDPTSWQRVLDEADERFGDVDVLINNAGIDVVGEFGDIGVEADRRMIEVNLLGSITGIKALPPRMRARASGHVITISSMQAFSRCQARRRMRPQNTPSERSTSRLTTSCVTSRSISRSCIHRLSTHRCSTDCSNTT